MKDYLDTYDKWTVIRGVRIHPLAELLPELEGEEFEDLVRDIAENGLIEKCSVIYGPDRKKEPKPCVLIDGRNRLRALDACIERGLVEEYLLSDWEWNENGLDCKNIEEITKLVLSRNLLRRHLTPDQRVQIAGKLSGKRIEQAAAEAMKAGQQNGGRPRKREKNSTEKVPQSFSRRETEARSARGVLAKQAGVNPKKAAAALALAKAAEESPEAAKLQEEVIAGKVTLREATAALKPEKGKGEKKKPKEEKRSSKLPQASKAEARRMLLDAVAVWKENDLPLPELASLLRELAARCD